MLEEIILLKAGKVYEHNYSKIKGTKVRHTELERFGTIFELEDYVIGFTSDTMEFEGFAEQYDGVDILYSNF